MEPFGDLDPGEGRADHDTARVVDDEPRRPGRVPADEARPRRPARLDVDRTYDEPRAFGRCDRVADRGHLRVGEDDARGERAVGNDRDVLAEDRVRGETPLVLA